MCAFKIAVAWAKDSRAISSLILTEKIILPPENSQALWVLLRACHEVRSRNLEVTIFGQNSSAKNKLHGFLLVCLFSIFFPQVFGRNLLTISCSSCWLHWRANTTRQEKAPGRYPSQHAPRPEFPTQWNLWQFKFWNMKDSSRMPAQHGVNATLNLARLRFHSSMETFCFREPRKPSRWS